MVTFLSSSPELSKRDHTSYVFKLCCLCLEYVVPELPTVSLGSPGQSSTEFDLAAVIEPLQNYSLTCSVEQNIFWGADSFSSCVEILAEFKDKALQPAYDPWTNVALLWPCKDSCQSNKNLK